MSEGWSWEKCRKLGTAAEAAHPLPGPRQAPAQPAALAWLARARRAALPYPAPAHAGPCRQPPEPRRAHSISCQPGSLAPSPPEWRPAFTVQGGPCPSGQIGGPASDCWAPSPAEADLSLILCSSPQRAPRRPLSRSVLTYAEPDTAEAT